MKRQFRNTSTSKDVRRSFCKLSRARLLVPALLGVFLFLGPSLHDTAARPADMRHHEFFNASSSSSDPADSVSETRDVLEQSAANSDPMLSESPIPDMSATSVLAVDLTSGSLLYHYDADVPVAPASTLKIITAMTALLVLDPNETIEIIEPDLVDTTVYSNAALQAGDQVSVKDLLAGLMIPSGGDAAKALARVAGNRLGPGPGQHPVSRFVTEMNDLSASLGMQNSKFVNPDGPDVPGQFTTARDLAIASEALLRDRLLAEIVAAPAWTMTVSGPNTREYVVYNTNALLGSDPVHGVKTGTTGEAGESVVLATRRGGNQILTVVMGSDHRYRDTLSLLQYIDDRVRWVEFGASDDFPGLRNAADRFGFVLAVPFTKPMLYSDSDRLHSQLSLGPRPRGTLPVRWGHVVFFHDGEELYQVPVLMTGDSSE
jgi:serine-type D-Ala-D-Ala carboxypeptidase (penicillin-binding protein 5/6)